MLNANPMHSYKSPQYPTKVQVFETPDMLKKYLPPQWQRNARIAGLATLFLAASCQSQKNILKSDLDSDAAAVVAPIFKHGDGWSSEGCVIVNPPVYLSEEEAMQVIAEELTKSGFEISKTNVSLENLTIYHGKKIEYDENYNRTERKGDLKPLNVDLYDEKKKIAVEYVARSDYSDLGVTGNSYSSVSSCNLQGAADSLVEEVKENGKGVYFGAFYDPVADSIDDQDYWNQNAENQVSKQYLRNQVKDFVDWLKAQGVM